MKYNAGLLASIIFAVVCSISRAAPVSSTETPVASGYYNPGTTTVTDLYVSPSGDDKHNGLTISAPMQTLREAWARVPITLTTTGYRLNLLPGTYPCEPGPEADNCVNYFENRHGTASHPLIMRALNGRDTVTIRGGLNIAQVDYLYLYNLNLVGGAPLPINNSGNNLLHLASVDHVLLHGLSVLGPDCANDQCNNLQEVLKVNQAQYVYVEDSTIGGAWHTVVDYFSVQYGHFLNNNLHTAGQWCMYIKGGSAYLHIEGNELHDCQLGFESGEASNLAVMQAPWWHYEAYDIKFINNLLHDIPGVGFGASGAYNSLFAYNTLYRVGYSNDYRTYELIGIIYGERGCTPTDEVPNAIDVCNDFLSRGAWGPSVITDSQQSIPNRNVYILNNLIYNPAPAQTMYQHFTVFGPIARPSDFANMPDPVRTDDALIIRGNIIWNGPPDHPLGIEEASQGCQSDNPTCNQSQLKAQNAINLFEPQLIDPTHGDYRPLTGGNVISASSMYTFFTTVTDFPAWNTFSPTVPTGTLTNTVTVDYDGAPRSEVIVPGAFGGRLTLTIHFYVPFIMR